jgi:hypothetical protein
MDIHRSWGNTSGMWVRWGVPAIALAAVLTACSGSDTETTVAASGSLTPLIPGQEVTLEGPLEESSAFVEGPGVLLEGGGDVSLTFSTDGGPVSGSFTQTLTGTDSDGNAYTVTYTGTLTGDYDPELGQFEGSYSYTSSQPDGFEAALPTDEEWDGGVVVTPDGCADTKVECAYGATQPNVDVIWELPLSAELINPAFVESAQ